MTPLEITISQAGFDLLQDVADLFLVRRIRVGVQQRHHDGVDVLALQHLRELAHLARRAAAISTLPW